MTKVDAFSKQGAITGWIYLITFIILGTDSSLSAIKYANSEESETSTRLIYEYILPALGFLLMATLSGLLIYGVVKKRHVFMLPLLVCVSIGLIYLAGFLVYECFNGFEPIFIFKQHIYVIGMQILILYPIYNLYSNIRECSKTDVDMKDIEYSNDLQKNSDEFLDNTEKKLNNDIMI